MGWDSDSDSDGGIRDDGRKGGREGSLSKTHDNTRVMDFAIHVHLDEVPFFQVDGLLARVSRDHGPARFPLRVAVKIQKLEARKKTG